MGRIFQRNFTSAKCIPMIENKLAYVRFLVVFKKKPLERRNFYLESHNLG